MDMPGWLAALILLYVALSVLRTIADWQLTNERRADESNRSPINRY